MLKPYPKPSCRGPVPLQSPSGKREGGGEGERGDPSVAMVPWREAGGSLQAGARRPPPAPRALQHRKGGGKRRDVRH